MKATNDKALKEWAVIVDALEAGDQILLLRKGGITEEGGSFQPKEREFFLFPNYTHQNPDQLQHRALGLLEESYLGAPEEGTVRISSYAVAVEAFPIPDRAALNRLDAEHIWSREYVTERFCYKPDQPLYALVLRVYHLPDPVHKVYLASYGGCTSWVTLDEEISTTDALPTLTDSDFERRRARLHAALCGTAAR